MKDVKLKNGNIKITPAAGCGLYCLADDRIYSEAVCPEREKAFYKDVPLAATEAADTEAEAESGAE